MFEGLSNSSDRCAAFTHAPAARPTSPRDASTHFLSNALVYLFMLVVLGLCGCGLTINSLPLVVEPNSVTFGTVQLGSTQTATLTLHNIGLGDVALNGMSVGDSAFTMSSGPSSVPAGRTATVQVSFTPTAAKSYSSQIAVMSKLGNLEVPVSGAGAQSSTQSGPPATPAIQISPTSLEFGAVTVGSSAQQDLTITSSGTAPLEIDAISLSPSYSTQSPGLPLTLQPGQTLNLPVQFVPVSAGAASGQLTVASNAAQSPTATIPLDGTGAAAQAPPPPPPGTPALTLSSSAVDFGSVPVGSQAPSSVILTSSGTADVVLQSVTISGPGFSAGQLQLPLTLSPGQQVSLPLNFSPSSTGVLSGQVTLGDNATGSPNTIALTGAGVAAATPSLAVTPSTVDFGDVTVGSDAFKTITLVANGTVPVTVSSVVVAGAPFSTAVTGLPRVLQPSQQLSVQVKFDPATTGNAAGTVTIGSDAAAPSVVALKGNGVAPATPSLAGSASSLSFGNVTLGSQATKTMTVTSTGTAPASITGGSLSGSGYTASFAGVPVQQLASPIVLQPGQQVNFAVDFDPTNVGASAGQLSLATDTGSPVNVSLTGNGTAAPSPVLTLGAASLDFGDVQVNQQAALQLTLTSTGTAPVTVSSAAIAGANFQISSIAYPAGIRGWPAVLNPGQQITLTVTFDPTKVGAATGSLTVDSDASGGNANVTLTGTGDAVPAPKLKLSASSLSFGSTTVGSKVSRNLTLSSNGTAPLIISSIALTGTQFNDGNPSLPVTLQPGQQLPLTVSFDPTSAGSDAETLTVTSNDPSGPAAVSLGGTATVVTTPLLSVTPASLDFGTATVNTTTTLPVTLTSAGSAPLTITAATVTGTGFSVSGGSFPQTLNPGQTVTVQVQFDPAKPGVLAGTLTIASNSSSGPVAKIPLSGRGSPVATPQLTLSSATLSFGSVTVNTSATLPLTLTSSGTAPVTVNSSTISGVGYTISGATFPATLNPGQSVTLQVAFRPSATGVDNGQLTIASDSSSNGTAVVSLSGTGTAAPVPQLTISAASLSFGNVTANTTATLPLTLTSTGTAPVTVNAATITGAAFGDPGASFPVTLNPNQSVTIKVQFDPSAVGAATGQLTITSNSSTNGTVVVPLSGNGTAAPSPQLTVSAATLSFGNVTVNSTATLPLTLTSTGTAPVTVSAAAISGAGFTDSGSTFPVTLNPNQSVTLQVQFDPNAAGAATGQLTINSNASSGSTTVVQLSGTGTLPAVPQLTVSAASLSFGNVTLASSATLPLTLTSTGTAPVTISAVLPGGAGFTDSGAAFPLTLAPGQSVTLQVQFAPQNAGAATGQLTIFSNSAGGNTVVVQLSGTGTAPLRPQLTLSAASLSFGNVTVNTASTQTLTLTSTGTAPVTVSGAALSGAGFSDSGAAFPVTLNPNQSIVLQVQFDPTTAGAATGQLSIASNSASGSPAIVQLSGNGTAPLKPQLTLSTASLSFGNVTVNTASTQTLTLTSTGTAPVTVSGAALSGAGFSDSGAALPVTLNPNQSITLQVQFDPTTAGAATGQLNIASNSASGSPAIVQLSGNGTAPLKPQLTLSAASLSFGNVTVNTASTQTLTLTSTGTAPVTVSGAALSGAGFSDSGAALPVTLNPNQSITLQVQFDPTTAGAATGQLSIASNSASGSPAIVSMSGNGIAASDPRLLVGSNSLAFGNVTVGSTATLSLTLTSVGTTPVTVSAATLAGAGFSDSGGAFPLVLNPNQSATLQVQFDPTSAGADSGSLTITSNSTTGGTVVVQLSGTGTAVPHEIDLNWDAPASSPDPVAGYNVYRSTNGGGSFSKLNGSAQVQTSYADTAVQSGTTYVYEVKSVDANGVESNASNQITLSVP